MLRAAAVFAVVLIHTCPPGYWQVLLRPFINFAVAAFLFLSGYLTGTDRSDWGAFYKKRIVRVIIPYIVWTLLYTTYNFIGNEFEFKRYIINLLTTKSTQTLYYIFVYIQFVLLTPLLGKLAKSKYRWLGFAVSPVSLVIFKYYWLISGVEINEYISTIWNICCLGWFTFYYLGLLLGNGYIVKQYDIKKLLIFYGLSIALQMLEGYGWLKLGETNCGTQLKLSSMLTSSIFLLMAYWYINNKSITRTNKAVVLIGDYSFGIYLSHIMVMNLLYRVPLFHKIPFGINSIIILLLSFCFVFIGRKICGDKLSKWLGFY